MKISNASAKKMYTQIDDQLRLTEEYENILKRTVEIFIEEGEAVSSSLILKKSKGLINSSSAKIRYQMSDLELEDYLEKSHSSAGRKPTIKGIDYYSKFLLDSDKNKWIKKIEEEIKQKFAQKKGEIEQTVDKAAEVISEITGITLVTTNVNINEEETMKGLELIPLSESAATIVMVVSSGKVHSKILNFNSSEISMSDLKIAVNIFKERLIDTKICDLITKTDLLREPLSQAVQNYQNVLESFVNQVFKGIIQENTQNKIYGKNNIILNRDINRQELVKLIDLIENYSVWEDINAKHKTNETTKINVNDSTALISKKIDSQKYHIAEISAVGTNTKNLPKMKVAIALLEDFLNTSEDKNK